MENRTMKATYIRVQTDDFDLGQEYQALRQSAEIGAIVSFIGLVRDVSGSSLQAMTLEYYPGMTEKALASICQHARQHWPSVQGIRLIHRVGTLALEEQIVLLLISSAHRADAYAASQFIMDHLKTQAPFWKKEHLALGEHWVDAKASDQTAQQRWTDSKD